MEHLLDTYGYVAVFGLVFAEACGIPLPGEIMLITAAAYAGTGHLLIPQVIEAAAAGAVGGFTVSYVVGRTGGRALLKRYGPYVRVDDVALERAERLFRRYGDVTVLVGRFVAILRAWAALLAGLNAMPVAKFMFFNILGGVLWATAYGMLAFEFGKPLIDIVVRYLSLTLLVGVIAVAAYFFVRWRRASRTEP